MKQKFSIALSLAVILSMLLTSLALADNVVNDVTVGGTDTFTAPGSTTIGYKINGTGGDGQNGCNASDGSPATITLSVPAGVTASATTLTFNACNVFQNVTFSSSTAGDYAINVSSISDSGTGSYKNEANFTLHVLAPADSTAPVIIPNVVGTLGNNGWYVSDVTVSWTVTDAESAISSSSGCGSTTINTDTAGTTLTCTATSAGGTSSQSVTIKRDASAPSISATPDLTANANGWNNTDVTVSYSCTDNGHSGVDTAASDLGNDVLTASGTASGTCVDMAGNSASASYDAQIDKVKPVITGSSTPAANANGWNNTDVAVSFSCTDSGGSGIDINTVAGATLSTENTNQSVTNTGSCTDKAGNTADSATVSGINIDKTAPSVSLVGGPANGQTYYYGFVPAAPTCSADDTLSGLDGSCSTSGYSAAIGTHTVSASASDKAGNSASVSATYEVKAWTLNGFFQPVDLNGVFNVAKNGSTIPLKFEIFAGSTELTDITYVKSLRYGSVACNATSPVDTVETTATGGTSLRYDAVAGQFVYNWKTPNTIGCFSVTMATNDGSTLSAFFKLK